MQAGIQPLKMDNTSLIEHIESKHLIKREAVPWWGKVVDAIVSWITQVSEIIIHFFLFYINSLNLKKSNDFLYFLFTDYLSLSNVWL